MSNTSIHTGILEEMTIDEVRDLDPEVVVLPLGSTEPHGPHLPYGTDVYQVDGICRRAVTRANERGARVLKYPTLPIGNNVNFKRFPFACRMRVRTLMNVVLDVIEAIENEGVRKIVIVNGHGGNSATLKATLREHTGRNAPDDGAFVCVTETYPVFDEVADRIEDPSDHAGEEETSRMMHLRPDLVRDAEFEEFPTQEPEIDRLGSEKLYFVPPWDGYMPRSAGGETRTSSAEKGEALVDSGADWIADVVVALHETEVHELFPYPQAE